MMTDDERTRAIPRPRRSAALARRPDSEQPDRPLRTAPPQTLQFPDIGHALRPRCTNGSGNSREGRRTLSRLPGPPARSVVSPPIRGEHPAHRVDKDDHEEDEVPREANEPAPRGTDATRGTRCRLLRYAPDQRRCDRKVPDTGEPIRRQSIRRQPRAVISMCSVSSLTSPYRKKRRCLSGLDPSSATTRLRRTPSKGSPIASPMRAHPVDPLPVATMTPDEE